MKYLTKGEISFIFLEFKVSNGYVFENKDETAHGRRYRKLKFVTSKANVIEFRRYHDNGGKA